MSDAATSAIKPVRTPVALSTEDGRTRLQRPETPTGIGIELADPANDPLPSDPDDPRIVDDDGDGNPGVTAHIEVSEDVQGDLFIARREIFAYDVLRPGRRLAHRYRLGPLRTADRGRHQPHVHHPRAVGAGAPTSRRARSSSSRSTVTGTASG